MKNINASSFVSASLVKIPGPVNNVTYLLVEMASDKARNALFSQKKLFKNSQYKLFVNELLMKEDSQIYKKARKDISQGLLHSVWTYQCKVWAKGSRTGDPFCLSEPKE